MECDGVAAVVGMVVRVAHQRLEEIEDQRVDALYERIAGCGGEAPMEGKVRVRHDVGMCGFFHSVGKDAVCLLELCDLGLHGLLNTN